MAIYERFGRIFYGVLLIASCFVSWGKWIVLAVGALLMVSSLQGLCIACKCKQCPNTSSTTKEE